VVDAAVGGYLVEIGDRLWNRVGRLTRFDALTMVHRACDSGTGQLDVASPTAEERGWLVAGNTITISRDGRVVQSGLLRTVGESKDSAGRTVSKPSWVDTLGGYLGSELLYPNPGGARTDGQGVNAFDLRSGYTTSVVLGYVRDNIAGGAWQPRQAPGLVVDTDPQEGAYLTDPVAARYDVPMLDFLRQVALVNGVVFWIDTVDRTHYFRARQIRDFSLNVQFSDRLHNLGAGSWSINAPKLTRIMVLGPGEGTDQVVIELTGAEAEAEERKWGRVFRGVYSSQTMVIDVPLADFAKFRADELRLGEQSYDTAQRGLEQASKTLNDKQSALADKLAASPQVPADVATARTEMATAQSGLADAHAQLVEAQATVDTATANKVAADVASDQANLTLTVAALDAAARRQLAEQGETVTAEYEILQGTFELGVHFEMGDLVAIHPDGLSEPIVKPVREYTESFSVSGGRTLKIIAGDYGSSSGTKGAFTTRELIQTVSRLRTRY
jgi:hypothetical protein